MKKTLLILSLLTFSFSAFTAEVYTTDATDIGTLMADPAAKAILEKYLPNTIANSQFSMAHSFTLEFIKGFDQTGELTDANMEKISEELGKLSAESEK